MRSHVFVKTNGPPDFSGEPGCFQPSKERRSVFTRALLYFAATPTIRSRGSIAINGLMLLAALEGLKSPDSRKFGYFFYFKLELDFSKGVNAKIMILHRKSNELISLVIFHVCGYALTAAKYPLFLKL